jgi:thiamine-monophosphate kinase
VPVVGGDTKLGDSTSVLGVALGSAQATRNLFMKNSARPGDLVWVSGEIGSCNAAVLGLRSGKMSSAWRRWAVRKICEPDLPLDKSLRLSAAACGHGGIDLSDGLGADLRRLCVSSGTGAIIDPERLPLAREVHQLAATQGICPWTLAFGAGGDFQFLVTSSQRHRRFVKSLGFFEIGRITARRKLVLSCDGRQTSLPSGGHRDARDMSFFEEISGLVKEAHHAGTT